MSENTSPIENEVITTTTTENFAVLGCAAPNSFDTLTLHKKFLVNQFLSYYDEMEILCVLNKRYI